MDSNIVSTLIIGIVSLLITAALLITFIKAVLPVINKRLDIKDKEVKNKKYELFINIDPDKIDEALNKYFETYINRYITYKFIANKSIYIKQEQVETMVRDVTKLIYINISELYIFYINMIGSVNGDDERLLEFIHTRVKNIAVETVSAYNRASIK